MMVREKNCYYAIALTDFFVFLSCAELNFNKIIQRLAFQYQYQQGQLARWFDPRLSW